MTSIALAGSTGLVGAEILKTLLSLPQITDIHTVNRREPSTISSKLHPFNTPETSKWYSHLATLSPAPSIFFSALGTTKGAAGSFAAQRAIDYDLNVELASAAKKAGVKVYVLISSASASSSAYFNYSKMKGELEDTVRHLGFDTTVILRPGLLVGNRTENRTAEAAVQGVARFLGSTIGNSGKDFWAQDAEVVARAAVLAGQMALKGGYGQVWIVNQTDIIRLGRTEWKG